MPSAIHAIHPLLASIAGAIPAVHPLLASIVDVSHVGYPVLFLLVMAESGGIPVPGETSLIAGAVLASQGKLDIAIVIPLAAVAAIVGDNIGYQIGKRGGRWVLKRPGPFHRQRLQVLERGEPFFERHGPKAVFFGRFLLGLRVWASWLAGATRMRWPVFFFWNAAGGICWATAVGLAAYFLGHAAGNAIQTFGLFGIAAVIVVVVGLAIAHLRHRRHEASGVHKEGEEGGGVGVRPAGGAGESEEDAGRQQRT